MANAEDPRARLVERGIKDANPGRVLKNCEHIFLMHAALPALAPAALLGRTLGLPSIGPKLLLCDKQGYRVHDAALDSAYAAFKREYCDTCRDLHPRPSGWEWSEEWQQEENLRHAASMPAFFRTIWPGI